MTTVFAPPVNGISCIIQHLRRAILTFFSLGINDLSYHLLKYKIAKAKTKMIQTSKYVSLEAKRSQSLSTKHW
jgi:hypothetical protein